ncbi:Mog1p/PsbP-like protein [Agrocybe pediades]|nr:Mog1p/PsbP-like protein [Agrocybe pediades]
MSVVRELFGGAITATTAQDLVDASDVRQVPDTQEVFMYRDSNVSIVVEILEQVEPSHFNDTIRFHFDSLTHDNSAENTQVETVYRVPNDRGDDTPSATILKGIQFVPKFNHTTPDKVQILMALYRIEEKSIDLVVTFNIPLQVVGGGAVDQRQLEKAQADFDVFSRSLRIVDFGLFA